MLCRTQVSLPDPYSGCGSPAKPPAPTKRIHRFTASAVLKLPPQFARSFFHHLHRSGRFHSRHTSRNRKAQAPLPSLISGGFVCLFVSRTPSPRQLANSSAYSGCSRFLLFPRKTPSGQTERHVPPEDASSREGKAPPAARSPQGDGAGQRAAPAAPSGARPTLGPGRGPPAPSASPGLTQGLAIAKRSFCRQPPSRLPPSRRPRPAPGPAESRPRSAYPQKANFQLPESHGRAG